MWYETVLILLVNLIISFAAGCATQKAAYVQAAKQKPAIAICLIMQFGIRPLVVYGLMRLLRVPDLPAVGMLLCAMAPGGNGSNLLEIIFGGNIELGIICTLCSSIFSSVAIPIDFYLYAKHFSGKNFTFLTMPWDDISSAIGCVVLGAILGAIVRYRNDKLGARLEQRAAALGLILLITAVIIALVSNLAALHAIPWSAWTAAIFPCPIGLAASYYPARYLFHMNIQDARTVATEVGECNIGVAYAILLLLYKGNDRDIRQAFAGIVAYTVFNEVYIFAAAFYWRVIDPNTGLVDPHGERPDCLCKTEEPKEHENFRSTPSSSLEEGLNNLKDSASTPGPLDQTIPHMDSFSCLEQDLDLLESHTTNSQFECQENSFQLISADNADYDSSVAPTPDTRRPPLPSTTYEDEKYGLPPPPLYCSPQRCRQSPSSTATVELSSPVVPPLGVLFSARQCNDEAHHDHNENNEKSAASHPSVDNGRIKL